MLNHFVIRRNALTCKLPRRLAVALGLLALSGFVCQESHAQTTQKGVTEFREEPTEANVPDLFRLKSARFQWDLKPVRQAQRHHVWALRFPSPLPGNYPENNVVHAEYFLPVEPPGPSGKYPAAVVLHILGADFPLSRFMAARLADHGIAALFIQLPYYGKRKPANSPDVKFLSSDINRSQQAMRQGVLDIRRGLYWLATRPEVDSQRLYATGVSLGGIMSALTVAVDPQVRGGVFTLAGGNLAEILWNMPEREAKAYRTAWEASGRSFEDLRRLIDPMDPLTYAERLKSKKIKMIAGKVDEVVPPHTTTALWNAAGKPPIVWYDAGHYSASAFILPAMRETIDFLKADSR